MRFPGLLFPKRTLYVRQSEPHIFAQPDAWDSRRALFGSNPALRHTQVLSQIACGQERLGSTPVGRFVFSTQARLHEESTGKEHQKARNLMNRDAPGPSREEFIDLF